MPRTKEQVLLAFSFQTDWRGSTQASNASFKIGLARLDLDK
jgi:hypothetical protein